MPKLICPSCQKLFSVPEETSAPAVKCPYCRNITALLSSSTPASRWYCARDKKKHGPYSWEQVLSLARQGSLHADDMLLQEGTRQWVRAGSVRALFGHDSPEPVLASDCSSGPPGNSPERSRQAPVAKNPARRRSRWLVGMAAGLGVSVVFGLSLLVGSLYSQRAGDGDCQQSEPQKSEEESERNITQEPTRKSADPRKKSDTAPALESRLREKALPPISGEKLAAQFLKRVNVFRTNAQLGSVTLDAGMSRGCLAHAKYLAKNADPKQTEASDVHQEDPHKPAYSKEGQRVGQSALVAFVEPSAALERWMGRLVDRASILDAGLQKIGLGFARSPHGEWVCVADSTHGHGEPIVLFPAAGQKDVPLAFSGGPEVPDARATGGFPITVTFPPAAKVGDARIELRDDGKRHVDAWVWTPEKPFAKGAQHNTIALIPKEMLRSGCVYEAKASAQVDGNAWNLTWTFATQDGSDSKGLWAKKALSKVNAYRARAGLAPVTLDEKLSGGCLAHARYLVLNSDHPAILGLGAHDEDPKLPGFSDEGRRAGKASDIAIGDYEPLDGVDAWMATLYHRVTILEPHLKTIGFGCARGKRLGWVTVLNVVAGRERGYRPDVVYYPVHGQTDVPLSFPNGGEEPNPIPEDKDGRAGYPITVFFPENNPLRHATGTLTRADGKEVPCWMSSLEKPANSRYPKHQGNCFCLIAKRPFEPNTTYHVHLEGQRGGSPWSKEWRFTTGDAGQSAAQATRRVMDRLNQARANAGLGAVVVDDLLSRGCQAHADFLVENSEALAKRKASVNEEDPLLPGYTREGAWAARTADVFSNAQFPVAQIDDLLGTFSQRVFLLDPSLQRVGFGCAHDVGRGWRCVLDLKNGRGDLRVVLYPAPKENNVPRVGSDCIKGAGGTAPGFPISVIFPVHVAPRDVQAVLTDAAEKEVEVWISSPERSFVDNLPSNMIALHPKTALQAGQTYSVTVRALLPTGEWRETWQFTTSQTPR